MSASEQLSNENDAWRFNETLIAIIEGKELPTKPVDDDEKAATADRIDQLVDQILREAEIDGLEVENLEPGGEVSAFYDKDIKGLDPRYNVGLCINAVPHDGEGKVHWNHEGTELEIFLEYYAQTSDGEYTSDPLGKELSIQLDDDGKFNADAYDYPTQRFIVDLLERTSV